MRIARRLALINFFSTNRNQEEGLPVVHKINNHAFFSRVDFDLNSANHLSASYNFDYSKNTNQTFDVPTYGNSANGIEGPSKINVVRVNLFTTVSPTKLNEAHFSYSRELRPRAAIASNVPADTAMGFVDTFRFGFRSSSNRMSMNYFGERRSRIIFRSLREITTSNSVANGCTR